MTLLFENECGAEFDFDMEAICNQCIETVLDTLECPYECEVSVLITDEPGIHEMNKEFRNVDAPTDVLSFPMMNYEHPGEFESETFLESMSVSMDTEELVVGDIVICQDIVKRQAKEYDHTCLREFSFLIVHSLLHLCGFDHMEEDEREEMENKQREIMDLLKILR